MKRVTLTLALLLLLIANHVNADYRDEIKALTQRTPAITPI